MKHITFYLDFMSPEAAQAFEKLPEVLMGHSYSVRYKPVALAGVSAQQLGLLCLAVARDAQGLPNRYVCETLFRHGMQALPLPLAPTREPDSAEVLAQLQAHTDEALALGVLGVPTLEVDGQLFAGLDALPRLQSYVSGDKN